MSRKWEDVRESLSAEVDSEDLLDLIEELLYWESLPDECFAAEDEWDSGFAAGSSMLAMEALIRLGLEERLADVEVPSEWYDDLRGDADA